MARKYVKTDLSGIGAGPERSFMFHTQNYLEDVESSLSSNTETTSGGGAPPSNASYITVNAESGLSDERKLAVSGDGLTLTDGGAGSSVTVTLTPGSITHSDLGGLTTGDAGHTQFLRSDTSDTGTGTYTLTHADPLILAGDGSGTTTVDFGAGTATEELIIDGKGSSSSIFSFAHLGSTRIQFYTDLTPTMLVSGGDFTILATAGGVELASSFSDTNAIRFLDSGATAAIAFSTDTTPTMSMLRGNATIEATAGSLTLAPSTDEVILGDGGNDVTLTFDGPTADGSILWDDSAGGFRINHPMAFNNVPGTNGYFEVRNIDGAIDNKVSLYFQTTNTSGAGTHYGFRGFCQQSDFAGFRTILGGEANASYNNSSTRWANGVTGFRAVANVESLGTDVTGSSRPLLGLLAELRLTYGENEGIEYAAVVDAFFNPNNTWALDTRNEMDNLSFFRTRYADLSTSLITNFHGFHFQSPPVSKATLWGTTAMDAFLGEATDSTFGATKGNVRMAGGDWDTGHLQLNIGHIWYDGSTLRGKASAPTGATDGVDILSTKSEKSWAFDSPSGAGATFYVGGFYDFAASDNDFNPVVNFGTANSSYAAHVFVVAASGATDTVITVTGTSITDAGTRTTSDTETLSLVSGSANVYYETSKKFIGQVTLEKTAGTDRLCNYGWCKYWDNSNTDFTVTGLEVTWLAGGSDATADILLRHHTTTGWTYNAGSTPTPPTALSSLQGTHVTEHQLVNGEEGAWKRTGLSQAVLGSASEGTIWEVITSGARSFETGNIIMSIEA